MRSQEKEKIMRDWIAAKAPNHRCAFCGDQEVNVGDFLMIPNPVTLLPGGQAMAVVPVACKTCAHVDLFNAPALGLLPPY